MCVCVCVSTWNNLLTHRWTRDLENQEHLRASCTCRWSSPEPMGRHWRNTQRNTHTHAHTHATLLAQVATEIKLCNVGSRRKRAYYDVRFRVNEVNDKSVNHMKKQITNTHTYNCKTAHCTGCLAAPSLLDALNYKTTRSNLLTRQNCYGQLFQWHVQAEIYTWCWLDIYGPGTSILKWK